jgi:uncharacterized membrane protein YagU involved in acid resistance
VAGTLDILYAWAFWRLKAGVPMQRILQSVAAGLLGSASFTGGARTAALGLVLHYLIAVAMSAAFYMAALRQPRLAEHPIASGAIYGVCLYVVMNYVVVPLSAAGPPSTDPLWVGASVAVHAVFVGIPIAVATRLALGRRGAAATPGTTG